MRERSVNRYALPVILLIAFLLTSGAAMALGPFSYTGVNPNGPDWRVIDYPNVTSTQTQRVTLELNTGNALSYADGHWGIGLRGPSFDQSFPLGRGIAFGYLGQTTNAWCNGVAVENFTANQYTAGIVPNTCQWFTFQPNTVYRIEVTATYYDVSYTISQRFYDLEFRRWIWDPVLSGGCIETAGQTCPQYAEDGNAGDAFVGTAFVPAGLNWSVSNMYVTHW
jgi:hypothetical protein